MLLGLALITLASAALLFSDRGFWAKGEGARKPRVAVFQFASQSVLDSAVKGLVAGMASKGYVNGKNVDLEFFNSAGDMATANAIAGKLTSGGYDLILTASTVAMQAVANANQSRGVKHVFCAVTDPAGAGVGISSTDPLAHPPYMAGHGTFQPVAASFRLARRFCPRLKRVGMVRNPAEACSEACFKKAKDVCAELGVTLLETQVDNSGGIVESTNAVIAQGAEAIYCGGDSTVQSGIGALIGAATKQGVPVFTDSPENVLRGAVFSLGADYDQVGFVNGGLAGDILAGLDPASVPVSNMMPERLTLNQRVAAASHGWDFGSEALTKAALAVGLDGQLKQTAAAVPVAPPPGKLYKVGLVYYGPDPSTDKAVAGLRDALAGRGFIEGKNLELRVKDALCDMAVINQILKSFANSDLDAVAPMTTPCLTAACNVVRSKPVVFNCVYAPLAAGAGKTLSDHLPNVTGVGSFPPVAEIPQLVKALLPQAKVVGTLYNSSEANSSKAVELGRADFRRLGMELKAMTVANPGEVYQAMDALAASRPDAVWITGDNTAIQAFDAIVKICRKQRLPLFINDVDIVGRGALAGVGVGFHDVGRAGGEMLADVLLGADPKTMPIQDMKTRFAAVNFAAAAELNLVFPERVLRDSSLFFNLRARFGGRPARVALVTIAENPLLDRACDGFAAALADAMLEPGKDFTLKKFCAQGELSRVPELLNAVRQGEFDLLVTCGTPVMVAAAKSVKDIPVLFMVASDPARVGAFAAAARPANFTGVHDDPPVERLVDMALANEPGPRRVGTIYDPAQPNSMISVEKLRKVCAARRLELLERQAGAVSELSEAALSLAAGKIDFLVLSADNVAASGFPAIYKVMSKAAVPVYTTEPGLLEQGAKGCIGDDYREWGRQAGQLGVKILAGVPPAALPVEKTKGQLSVVRGAKNGN